MTIDTHSARSRRLPRTAAVTLGLALGSLTAPAHAAPPEAWPEPDNGSMLDNLLFLVGVPILVFIVLTLMVYLPSMMKRHSSEPALAFQERSEWFGGPRKGVEGLEAGPGAGTGAGTGGGSSAQESGKGGASARW